MTNKKTQEEIILEEFDKEFDDLYGRNEVGFVNKFTSNRYDEIKQFLIKVIDKAYEAGKNDMFEEEVRADQKIAELGVRALVGNTILNLYKEKEKTGEDITVADVNRALLEDFQKIVNDEFEVIIKKIKELN